MIYWKHVVDDYGDVVSVTEIVHPNYYSVIIQRYK